MEFNNIINADWRSIVKRMKFRMTIEHAIFVERRSDIHDAEDIEIIKESLTAEKEIYLFEKWVLPLIVSNKKVQRDETLLTDILSQSGFSKIYNEWPLERIAKCVQAKKDLFSQKVKDGTNLSYEKRTKEQLKYLSKSQKEGRKRKKETLTSEQLLERSKTYANNAKIGHQKSPNRGNAISEGKRKKKESLTEEQLLERKLIRSRASKNNNKEKSNQTKRNTKIKKIEEIYNALPDYEIYLTDAVKIASDKLGYLAGKAYRHLRSPEAEEFFCFRGNKPMYIKKKIGRRIS
jgi:hypothetical protein